MAKNKVIKTFSADGTWVCPAGVTRVKVSAVGILRQQVSCGSATTHILTMAGDAYGCGLNQNGQIGNPATVAAQSSPILVYGGFKWRQISSKGGSGTTSNHNSTAGLSITGYAYCWGDNSQGQIGDGTIIDKSSPVLVSGGLRWREIQGAGYFTIGIQNSGDARAWGNNSQGQLGVGDFTSRSTPVTIVGGFKWITISGGGVSQFGFALGIDSNKNARAWGANANGQLGVGDVSPRSSPILVLGGKTWKSLSAGNTVSVGVTEAGDAYCWGDNSAGSCGTGVSPLVTAAYSSPVLVVGGYKFRFAVAGQNMCLGVTVDGDMYTWGSNVKGQLGDGTVVAKSSPVLVIGGTKWRSAAIQNTTSTEAAVIAIATTSDAYGWGNNSSGALGFSNVTSVSSPTIVGAPFIWRAVDRALVNTNFIDVTPGQTYSATVFASVIQFGPNAIYSDISGSGSLPTDIVLEYDA